MSGSSEVIFHRSAGNCVHYREGRSQNESLSAPIEKTATMKKAATVFSLYKLIYEFWGLLSERLIGEIL